MTISPLIFFFFFFSPWRKIQIGQQVQHSLILTFSHTTNIRLFQTEKKFADDNFELDDNGRKFSKWVENTVGKGEIARYEQFLLFPQCFQKTSTADR